VNLNQAIRTVFIDQTNGWAGDTNPTPREAIDHARNVLSVDSLLDIGDGNYGAYRLVLEASDEAIEAALNALDAAPDDGRTPKQIKIEDAQSWREDDVLIGFTRVYDSKKSETETVALTLDELQELIIQAHAILMAKRGECITSRS
jgi:hypothetical protein